MSAVVSTALMSAVVRTALILAVGEKSQVEVWRVQLMIPIVGYWRLGAGDPLPSPEPVLEREYLGDAGMDYLKVCCAQVHAYAYCSYLFEYPRLLGHFQLCGSVWL